MHKSDGEKRRKRLSFGLAARYAWTGRLFCLPLYIGALLFFLVPLGQSLLFCFQSVTPELGSFSTDFIGGANFRYAFRENASFVPNLIEAVMQMLYQVPVILVSSLFFALILNQKFRGRLLARAVFFLPVIVASGVVMQIISQDAVSQSMMEGGMATDSSIFNTGVLEEFLIETGLPQDVVDVFGSIIANLFDLLWRTGIQMLMFLAGLQSISPSLYEASSIEGATAWENFWMVTLPMLAPILLVNTVYTVVDSFTDLSNPVMEQILNHLSSLEYGRASVMGWVFTLVMLVLLGVIFALFRRTQKNRQTA